MNDTGTYILYSLTFLIPQLIILSACFYYLIKKITAVGLLLFMGTMIGLLLTIFNIIVLPYLYKEQILDQSTHIILSMSILGPLSFLASLSFSTGFFLLIYNVIKNKKEEFLN